MRLAVLLVLAAACSKATPKADPPPAPTKPAIAPSPVVPVAPVVADLALPSLEALFHLDQRAPTAELAGFEIGKPTNVERRRVAIPGWAGDAYPIVRDGVVAHIVLELAPVEGDQAPQPDLAQVQKAMTKRWGAPIKRPRAGWRGPTSQLYIVEYDGFLRGTPSLVIDLLPPGDTHVCGTDDGFNKLFTPFHTAVVKRDTKALTALVTPTPDNDMVACNDPAVPFATCVAQMSLPTTPSCHMSREVYYWRTIEQMHGGAYFEFSRTGTTWIARGPFAIGHDDDPNPTAP